LDDLEGHSQPVRSAIPATTGLLVLSTSWCLSFWHEISRRYLLSLRMRHICHLLRRCAGNVFGQFPL